MVKGFFGNLKKVWRCKRNFGGAGRKTHLFLVALIRPFRSRVLDWPSPLEKRAEYLTGPHIFWPALYHVIHSIDSSYITAVAPLSKILLTEPKNSEA